MNLFDHSGRRIPGDGDRVFGNTPSFYYKLNQPEIDYEWLLNRSKQFNSVPAELSLMEFKSKAEGLLEEIKNDQAYSNLLNGVRIPFVVGRNSPGVDIGEELESGILPSLKESFNNEFPQAHFKAVLQSNSELLGNISLAPGSRYQDFVSALDAGPIIGWYFPQALQEFDINSQRIQMARLPELKKAKVCLSGGIDICAAVAGLPHLLISDEFYTPILCMSAYLHRDSRLVLLLKAYGPHLEFWCMSQMLTKEVTQVSEQWTGGVTVF